MEEQSDQGLHCLGGSICLKLLKNIRMFLICAGAYALIKDLEEDFNGRKPVNFSWHQVRLELVCPAINMINEVLLEICKYRCYTTI